MTVELPMASIDRNSAVPFYFQLKELLAEEIRSGRWRPGERVSSEPALGDHFEVSRTTVRQALGELETEGLIRREKGRGTFVAEPRSTNWVIQSAASFHEDASAHGLKVRSEVLRREVAPLADWVARSLGMEPGVEGVCLARRRWLDDELVMYVENYLPTIYWPAVADADLERGSLYATLRDVGLEVGRGRRVMEATAADEALASTLELDVGTPVLQVEAVSWTTEDEPFECYRAWHRSDRAQIEVHVVSHQTALDAGIDTSARRLRRKESV